MKENKLKKGMKLKIKPYTKCECTLCAQGYGYFHSIDDRGLDRHINLSDKNGNIVKGYDLNRLSKL